MTRSARLAVALWIAGLALCVAIVARTTFTADMTAFLPRSPTPAQQVLVDQLRDGVVSRLILVGIEGAPAEGLAGISKALAARLRRDDRFVAVNNGETGDLATDADFLLRYRYLLSDQVTPQHFTAASLHAELEDQLQALGSAASVFVERLLPQDPTGEVLHLVEQLESGARPASRHGVWFSRDGRRALMVLQTRAAGFDLDAQEQAMAAVRSAFAQASAGGPAGEPRLLMSGPGVFSVHSRAAIRGDAQRFSVIATVLIASLLLAVYRSPRVLALGLLPVASGALAGIAAVSAGFGAVHGITLGFGATLIGEGVDYAIYLFTQNAPGEAPEQTLRRLWPTLRLGVMTSVCGFSAMLLSGFPGLAQLGLFSISGLLVAVAVTRWVLPALLPPGFSVPAVSRLGPAVAALVRRAPRLRYPLLAAAALALVYLAPQSKTMWSQDLSSLSPVPRSDPLLDEQLRRELGAPDVRHLVIIEAATQDEALAAAERVGATLRRLVGEGVLAGFDAPDAYLPSRETQLARQHSLPAPEELRKSLQQALTGLPFRPGVFEPFLEQVEAARHQGLLDRAGLQGTALALKLDSLLVRRASGWASMLPLRGVADPERLQQEIAALNDARVVLLDLKRESNQLYRSYLREALNLSAAGAAIIVVLLGVSLRSPRRVFDVVAPLAAAVLITCALLLLTAGRLTLFHLVGFLLVVAVGSNYTLFFDRQNRPGGGSERTYVSLALANVSTMIGFGLLSFSSVPVLDAIGTTVGVGAFLSLAFAAILAARPPAATVR